MVLRLCNVEESFTSNWHVLDLSNREFADLLRDELGVDVQDLRYSSRGTSKANRLRCIIEECEADAVARLLRALWDVREQRGWTPGEIVEPRPSVVRRRYMEVVLRLERMANISDTDALTAFVESATLEELIEAIQRDVAAGRHAAALDRLHTYCMKRFTNLLDGAGLPHVREEPLQNRVGKYVRWLIDTRSPRPMTQQILKNAMGILQQFNDIRNNRSFAHDNDLIEPDEARLIFDSVVAILRFVEHAQNGATPKLP